jgi:hypothetical protein
MNLPSPVGKGLVGLIVVILMWALILGIGVTCHCLGVPWYLWLLAVGILGMVGDWAIKAIMK